MVAKYARSVRALCPMTTCFQRQTTNELKGKGYHKDLSRLTSTGCHSVHVVIVSVYVVVREVTPSVAPNALQASVCDEQLMSIGGEIALSGNTLASKKTISVITVAH